MKVYLAARFDRRAELAQYAKSITEGGDEVTSRWLHNHDNDEITPENCRIWAQEDLEDIDACDLFICFTEPDDAPRTSGGRHVEFGYALAQGKELVIIGEAENIFYHLYGVEHFKSWSDVFLDDTPCTNG